MTPDSDATSSFHVDGDLTIRVGQAPPPGRHPDLAPEAVSISGRVADARTGMSVPGLIVTAVVGTKGDSSEPVGS